MSQMSVPIGASDAQTANSVLTWAQQQATGFDPDVLELGVQPSYKLSYAQFSATATTPWTIPAGSTVDFAYGTPPGGNASLRTWQLPDTMVNLPHAPTKAGFPPLPCFDMMVATRSDASGATRHDPVAAYSWATQIGITVKLVAAMPPTPAAATTYELVGANEYDVVLLERLLNTIGLRGSDSGIAQLLLLHATPGGSGLASDGDALTTFITQANLSTVTRPPGAGLGTRAVMPVPGGAQKPGDFIRLLWECSITRSGGYYLYYSTDPVKHTGLPSTLFNDKGEAQLTLLVLHAVAGTQVQGYVNAAVTAGYIDPTSAAVYAQALPQPAQYSAGASDSLQSLGTTYRMTPPELAAANAGAALGAAIKVNGGSYQVPTEVQPADIAALATQLGTTSTALAAANPTLDFTQALPQWTVLTLPDGLSVAPKTAGRATLAQVAAYYSVAVDMLAEANAPVQGIFQGVTIAVAQMIAAPPDQDMTQIAAAYYMDPVQLAEDNAGATLATTLTVQANGGFYEVPGTSGAGTLAAIAQRFGADPNAIQAANPSLDWSKAQPPLTLVLLPALTRTPGTSPSSSTFAEMSSWYGIPVARLALDNAATPGLLTGQLRVRGGPLVRQAASPPGVIAYAMERVAPAPLPDPTDAGYPKAYLERLYDLLSYQVPTGLTGFGSTNPGPPLGPRTTPDGEGGARLPRPTSDGIYRYQKGVPYSKVASPRPSPPGPKLPDPSQSPYLGVGSLLRLDFEWNDMFGNRAVSPLSDVALDPNSPLNRPPAWALYTDPIIGLSEWPSLGYDFSFTAGGSGSVSLELNLGFDQCTYITDGSHSCAALDHVDPIQRATRDLEVYARIWYQLAAAAGGGLDVTVETSMLPGAPFTVPTASMLDYAGAIYGWLVDRIAGTIDPVPTPPAITVPVALAANAEQVYELTVDLVMSRPPTLVDPDLRVESKTAANRTSVPPQHAPDSTGALTLGAFAQSLETAAATAGVGLKVAVGVDRSTAERASSGAPLWLVRVGTGQGEISIDVQNTALVYATRPISNVTRSQTVDITGYVRGSGLTGPVAPTAFSGIDLDTWARQALAAVDNLLSPANSTAIALIDAAMTSGKPNLPALTQAKKDLAAALKTLALPLTTGTPGPGTDAAQSALEQQLLEQLGSFYAVDAIVQFPVTVAALPPTPPELPRQLYGPLAQTADPQPVTLGSAKIPLVAPGGSVSPTLTFLLSTASGQQDLSQIEPSVTLQLAYAGTNIEHQIGTLPGIADYQASSWLSFLTGVPTALSAQMADVVVPLILHGFPAPPTMQSQTGLQTSPDDTPNLTLAETLGWDYTFTYGESVHYEQDTVHVEIEFNHDPKQKLDPNALLQSVDPMPALAQFVSVLPDVEADLSTYVAAVDPSKIDPSSDAFKAATAALSTFTGMASKVASTIAGQLSSKPRPMTAGMPSQTYELALQEASVVVPSKLNPSKNVHALVVTVLDNSEKALDVTALVDLGTGYTRQPAPKEPSGLPDDVPHYSYSYMDASTGDWLRADKAETIGPRQVTLPDLNVLARQDAWASAYIGRNEFAATVFQYQTPAVYFTSPQYPTNVFTAPPIEVAALPSGTKPATKSPEQHLQALFDALFATAPAGSQTIKLECRYEYTLTTGLLPVSMPVLLLPPTPADPTTDLKVPAGGCTVGSDVLLCKLGSVIRTWWSQNAPSTTAGKFTLDLTVMSQLTGQPLIDLRNLTLTEQYVNWS